MRTKLLTAAITAATLLSPGVARADWVHIASSSDRQFFIDDSAVERRGDTISYWQQDVFTVPQQGSIKSITAYQSVNCASRVNRAHRIIAYNAADKAIGEQNLNEQQSPPETVVPGTNGERIYKFVCSNW